ncbi:MAG: endonuclease/exonuclease/phosphatase family protein [Candidatus Thiodiazotropha sp.]
MTAASYDKLYYFAATVLPYFHFQISGLIGDNFTKCPDKALELEVRKLRFIEEILRYQPTVLCLEEVDLFPYLKETLTKCGYVGIFYPKPDSPCLGNPYNHGPDGCAIFYNSSKLKVVKSEKLNLKAWNWETNQVAVICHFQTKSDISKDFTVAATHFKAGYKEYRPCEDIRKEQAMFLTRYLKEFYGEHPLVLCGDLNFPCTELGYDIFKCSDLRLTSAYTHLSADRQEPEYTFWTINEMEQRKTIDYIWYTKKGLKVKSVLNIPSEEEAGEGRLPSLKYPSDHLSLVCDFALEDDLEQPPHYVEETRDSGGCLCL